jgi:L-ornithine N5-oxygenase
MPEETFDLLGLGFGPAGIALATAIEDWREAEGITASELPKVKFFERRGDSGWQSALLLPGTDINHHFLRDVATPRNPRSRFTFVNYLKEKGRLFSFGLLRGAATRLEWSDYVLWVANQLRQYASYDTEVTGIEPCIEDGVVKRLRVQTAAGEALAANVVVNGGQKPKVPEEFKPWLSDRFFHTSNFLPALANLDRDASLTFVVVGSGQSAAESVIYLTDEFKNSRFFSVHRRIGFKLLDDGHFSTQIYFPQETDYFHSLRPEHRAHALQDIWLTNYSTIDWEVSRTLYAKMYEAQVLGQERVFVLNRRRVADIEQKNGRYALNLADVYSGDAMRVEADVVILCTGFMEELFPSCLQKLRPYLEVDEMGGLQVDREYQVVSRETFLPRVFLNGLCERTHGMSDSTSFSMMALKAGRIFEAWRRGGPPTAPSPVAREAAVNLGA